MRDALKNYLTLASGLTEVGRQRAMAAAKALVAQGEATAEQVGNIAEDLVETSKANREMVTQLVRTEVEKALNKAGLATADSVQQLTKRLHSLEAMLRDASTPAEAAETTTHELAAPAKKAAAKTAAKTAGPAVAKTATKTAAKAVAKPAKAATAPAKKAGGTASAAKKPAKKASS